MHTTRRLPSLATALTSCDWTWPLCVPRDHHSGGDTRKAKRKCWDTQHPPSASLKFHPSNVALPRPHPVPGTSCLVPAAVPVPEVRILPVCTDMPLSDFCFLPPFPDINLRSCSTCLLPTHPPSFQELLPLPPPPSYPRSHTPAYLFSLLPVPMTLLHITCLFLKPKSANHAPKPSQSPPGNHPVQGRRECSLEAGGKDQKDTTGGLHPRPRKPTSFVKNRTYMSAHSTCAKETAAGDWYWSQHGSKILTKF